MRHIFYLLLFLATFQLASIASEEEFVSWQSVSIKSPEIPEIGAVLIDALTQNDSYQKLEVTAFGRVHTLSAADLKRLEGFPLSSLKVTHEAGYVQLGGHTVHLKFSRTYYDETKKLIQSSMVISIPKDAALTISGPKTL